MQEYVTEASRSHNMTR